jgi:CDP-diacylglycerol--serine O-phosphatidyltransferase
MPTLFTVGNLFCGFSSIVQGSLDHLEVAALLVVLAGILDGLDGRIARLTGSTSAFGLQFDSLADIVSFGIAPAFLAFQWALHLTGRAGWSIAFLFVVCAAMRLARFNIQAPSGDRRHFVGLPSPMAGGMVASLVYTFPAPHSSWVAAFLSILIFAVALSMISRLRYRSFGEIDLRNRRSYVWVLPIAAVLVAVAVHPEAVLVTLFAAYLCYPPALLLCSWALGRVAGAAPSPEVADEPALH